MDSFLNYETDWKELRDSIRKRAEVIPSTRGDLKRKEIQLANEEIEEADEILASLELAAQSVGTDAALAKVTQAEADLTALKQKIRRAETFFGAADDRDRLMGSTGDLAVTSGDQRERVMQETDRLRHTTDVIKHALRTAGEAEQMGIGSLEQLETQRETIHASRAKIRSVDDSLKSAKRILTGISRRVMTNKLISMVLILVLLGGIILIAYLKFGSDDVPVPTTTTMGMQTPAPSTPV